jgi:signal peptidase I
MEENVKAVSEETSKPKKSPLSIVITVLTWMVVAFAVFVMIFTIVSVNVVGKNEAQIFGHRFYIVKTDSMSLSENNKDMDVHINAGDMIITKIPTDAERYKLEPGQIITFISKNEDTYGEPVTHMIKQVEYDENGKLIGYTTFGTNTGEADKVVVEPDYVLGTYVTTIPVLGHFFAFLKTTPGYIVCILIPFLLLIGYQGVNCIRLFRRYKKEQMAEIQAERDQIEEERKASAEMLKELQALKEQLAAQQATKAEEPKPEPEDNENSES